MRGSTLWTQVTAGVLVLFFIGSFMWLANLVPDSADEVAVYTLWLTIVTGLMAVATAGLVFMAVRQFDDSRLNNRAYIAVDPLGLSPWRGSEAQILGLVSIANVGVLPARKLKWSLCIKMTNDGDATDFPSAEPLRGDQVVVGRSTMTRGTRPASVIDAKYCFVWGVVEYDDGYGGSRRTRFCHRYNCDRNDFRKSHLIPAHDARQHEAGNEAD